MATIKPHISILVSNIESSVAFYETLFGVSVSKRRPGYAKFDLMDPALNFSMVERSPAHMLSSGPGGAGGHNAQAGHFGVQVQTTDDVTAAHRRLSAAGLQVHAEENTSCCYAVQDKVWVYDPDGNPWEFFVVKGESTSLYSADEATAASTGCCLPGQAAVPSTPSAHAVPSAHAKPTRTCCP